MHLSKEALRQRILNQKIISNYDNLDTQLTANGFDVRLAGVIEVFSGGRLAIKKEENLPPKLGKAVILKGFEHRLKEYTLTDTFVVPAATVRLEKNQPYFAMTCEELNTPTDLMFSIAARTSLFRLTQSSLLCSFGEAGYKGFLTFMLIPFLSSEIELGARFAQLAYSQLLGNAKYDEQQQTTYQGGRIF